MFCFVGKRAFKYKINDELKSLPWLNFKLYFNDID